VQHSVPLWSYFLQVRCRTDDRVCNPRAKGNSNGLDGCRRVWPTALGHWCDIQQREQRLTCGWHWSSAAWADCCNSILNVNARLRPQIFNTSITAHAIISTDFFFTINRCFFLQRLLRYYQISHGTERRENYSQILKTTLSLQYITFENKHKLQHIFKSDNVSYIAVLITLYSWYRNTAVSIFV